MEIKLFLSAIILLLTQLSSEAQVIAEEVLQHAHAHNDYAKANPLWDALENGCASIEIDVFAFKGELIVSHVNLGLNKKKTLTESYLNPLKLIIEEQSYIYKDQALVLMIDFKSNSAESLELLRKAITPIKEMFSYYSHERLVEGSLKLVISGSGIQYDQVRKDENIYFFKDGSVHYCEENIPVAFTPRGSTSYSSQFKWKGKKEMPEADLLILRAMLAEAEKCNKKLRFYGMPSKQKIWKTFLDEGVYWINIDKPSKFKKFYQKL
jgi:hypothetical protein